LWLLPSASEPWNKVLPFHKLIKKFNFFYLYKSHFWTFPFATCFFCFYLISQMIFYTYITFEMQKNERCQIFVIWKKRLCLYRNRVGIGKKTLHSSFLLDFVHSVIFSNYLHLRSVESSARKEQIALHIA
jgi:hypothetical protein